MHITIKISLQFVDQIRERQESTVEPQQEDKGQNASWSDFNLTHNSVMGPTIDDMLYWLVPLLGITGPKYVISIDI